MITGTVDQEETLAEYATFEEWVVEGDRLASESERVMWAIGDWWRSGQKYGERARHAVESGRWSFGTYMNAGYVAGQFETSRRREALPFSHHQEVAALPAEVADDLLAAAEANQWTRKDLRAEVKRHKRVARTAQMVRALPVTVAMTEVTGDDYYTDASIIHAVRRVMGGIDLDPASHPLANQVVEAGRFHTVADDGLSHDWKGRVWLNPPFGQWDRWAPKVISEWDSGRVEELCLLAATRTTTARVLLAAPDRLHGRSVPPWPDPVLGTRHERQPGRRPRRALPRLVPGSVRRWVQSARRRIRHARSR